jgi:hypothetical protein
MGYSYWYSYLNRTIYVCPVIPTLLLKCYPHIQSQNDIPLAYSSSPPLRGRSRRLCKPNNPLYPTFVVYFTTIGGRCYTMWNESTMYNIFNNLKNFFNLIYRVSFITYWSQIVITNIRNFFRIYKLFCNFFTKCGSGIRLFSVS